HEQGEINVHPFFHTILTDFIKEEDFVENLEKELSELDFKEKNNDLYKFHQSDDLKHSSSPHISAFCKLLETDVKEWLCKISDIELTEEIDVFASKYEYTDILLCHDDELEKRRFAYIYYVVPSTWSEEDGGHLDLFSADHHIQPKEIVKSILPKRNNFLFFEVTETSFHQVAEILSLEKTRLSISGWFHGPPLPRQSPHKEHSPQLTPYITVDEDEFYSWINPVYLVPDVQGEISEKFESESEIQLTDFIKKDKYNELKKALKESDIHWSHHGPANKRKYYVCNSENQPAIIKECVKFLQSDAMFLVLSNITGLKLHELAPESDDEEKDTKKKDNESKEGQSSRIPHDGSDLYADSTYRYVKNMCDVPQQPYNKNRNNLGISCYSEVRKWSHGCYTLAYDKSHDQNTDFSLDAVFFMDCSDWKTEYGGFTTYIAKDEDDELLSVTPEDNCLALVYRDKNTLKFIKHINHKCVDSSQPQFYDISTVYYE
ncbi:hypothetical protein LOTGIDRAFT_120424, partial [Lottia gigantea]